MKSIASASNDFQIIRPAAQQLVEEVGNDGIFLIFLETNPKCLMGMRNAVKRPGQIACSLEFRLGKNPRDIESWIDEQYYRAISRGYYPVITGDTDYGQGDDCDRLCIFIREAFKNIRKKGKEIQISILGQQHGCEAESPETGVLFLGKA